MRVRSLGRVLALVSLPLAVGIMLRFRLRVRNKLLGKKQRAALPPAGAAKATARITTAKAPSVAAVRNATQVGAHHICFSDVDGVLLRGLLLLPSSSTAPTPALVMVHGFSLTWRQGLLPLARACQAAGIAVLMYDHRCFGESEGEPRCCVDAWAQVRGIHCALEYLASRGDAIDANRMAVFGFSLSGGMVFLRASNYSFSYPCRDAL